MAGVRRARCRLGQPPRGVWRPREGGGAARPICIATILIEEGRMADPKSQIAECLAAWHAHGPRCPRGSSHTACGPPPRQTPNKFARFVSNAQVPNAHAITNSELKLSHEKRGWLGCEWPLGFRSPWQCLPNAWDWCPRPSATGCCTSANQSAHDCE